VSSPPVSATDPTVDLTTGDGASSAAGLVTDRGETIIPDSVVAKVAGRAAAEVDGVGAVADTGLGRLLARSSSPATARATAVVDRGSVTLDITLNIVYPRPVATVTAEVRAHVTHRVTELCGMTARRIDITVPELVTLPRPARSRVE